VGFPKRLHDPNAVLDYPVDWSAWLPDGDTIVDVTVTVPDDITLTGDPEISPEGTIVVAWLAGGTADVKYDVTYHIVTAQGREDDRSITLVVRER
jgi:hypothetical protein